jgi:NAD(P)-dependent dehydrogenase (short-subunit alcohol dehydrogenase family)
MTQKVALITGALSGIGRASAFILARDGYAVAVSGRREDAGIALQKELEAKGAKAIFMPVDVHFEDQIRNFVDKTVQRFGRLDAAINCAGVDGSSLELVNETEDSIDETLNVNIRGTIFAMKHQLRVMIPQRSGAIVNCSSTMARVARPGLGVYCASKRAVEGLTQAGAVEAAPYNVRVNAIAPGSIDTPMLDRVAATRGGKEQIGAHNPLGRVGTAEEAAELIAFLASDKAGFITGQSIPIEGGRLSK